MIKTINIDDSHSIELNCSMGWLLIYRSQFGKDILPELLPAIEAGVEFITSVLKGTKEVDVKSIIDNIDSDSISDAFITLSGLELVTVLQIAWAMAKNNDRGIPSLEEWVNQFETFPIDVIVPEIVKAIAESSVSTKNLNRLQNLAPKKSQSKKSSAPELKKD